MARVIKAFTDRLTNKIYLVGDEYEGNKERLGELSAGGYVTSGASKKEVTTGKKSRSVKSAAQEQINSSESTLKSANTKE